MLQKLLNLILILILPVVINYVKYLSNLNVYQNNIETYAKYNKTIIVII